MVVATHKKTGKTHNIEKILESKKHWLKGTVDGVEMWFGKKSYTFVKVKE